jgi:hypothetical protein
MRIKNDELERLIGYSPSKQMRIEILKEVREGKTIEEAASKFNLATMAILDADGKFNYNGQRVTPDEWREINPLGEFGKIVIIGTRDVMERYRKLKINT